MTDRTDITGTVTDIDGAPNLVLTRTFAARAADVWRELTESARLERWIGRWEGDPKTGHVAFFMTSEDPDAAPRSTRSSSAIRPAASPATPRPAGGRGTCGSSSCRGARRRPSSSGSA